MGIKSFKKISTINSLKNKLLTVTNIITTYVSAVSTSGATTTSVGGDVLLRWTSPGSIGILSTSSNSTTVSTKLVDSKNNSPTININGDLVQTSLISPYREVSQQNIQISATSTNPTTITFTALLIGRGGGCGGDPNFSPGGGAGGFLEGTVSMSTNDSYDISVSGSTGISGPFGNVYAYEGGGGGAHGGGGGGSGGGGGFYGWGNHEGGTAIQTPFSNPKCSLTGYGNPGYGYLDDRYGNGGGGASSGGPITTPGRAVGANGGSGRSNSITGSPLIYSQGGRAAPSGSGPPGIYGSGGNGNTGSETRHPGTNGVLYFRY